MTKREQRKIEKALDEQFEAKEKELLLESFKNANYKVCQLSVEKKLNDLINIDEKASINLSSYINDREKEGFELFSISMMYSGAYYENEFSGYIFNMVFKRK